MGQGGGAFVLVNGAGDRLIANQLTDNVASGVDPLVAFGAINSLMAGNYVADSSNSAFAIAEYGAVTHDGIEVGWNEFRRQQGAATMALNCYDAGCKVSGLNVHHNLFVGSDFAHVNIYMYSNTSTDAVFANNIFLAAKEEAIFANGQDTTALVNLTLVNNTFFLNNLLGNESGAFARRQRRVVYDDQQHRRRRCR